eukprot:4892147-Amphidinium_carterae.2
MSLRWVHFHDISDMQDTVTVCLHCCGGATVVAQSMYCGKHVDMAGGTLSDGCTASSLHQSDVAWSGALHLLRRLMPPPEQEVDAPMSVPHSC